MSLELEDLKTGQEHGRYSACQADRTELLKITEKNLEKISISSRQEDVQRKIIQEPKLEHETNPEPKRPPPNRNIVPNQKIGRPRYPAHRKMMKKEKTKHT